VMGWYSPTDTFVGLVISDISIARGGAEEDLSVTALM
jgi:hypothetical protein